MNIPISVYKRAERTWTLDVYEKGNFHCQIKSSGPAVGYETLHLFTDETTHLKLILAAYESNPDVWLSVQEVGNIILHSFGAVTKSLAQ